MATSRHPAGAPSPSLRGNSAGSRNGPKESSRQKKSIARSISITSRLTLNRRTNESGQIFFPDRRADEQLLPGAVRQRNGLPAILRRHSNPDLHRPLRIAHRPDHSRYHRTNLFSDHEPFEHWPKIFQNAVLNLELALRRPEPEG